MQDVWKMAACALVIASLSWAVRAEEAADDFVTVCMQAHAKAKNMSVKGKDGWFFLKGELRHVSAGAFWGEDAAKAAQAPQPEFKDPLPAIIHYKEQLEKAGIELILVPVPPKAVIFPDELPGGAAAKAGETPPRLDVRLQEFYKVLAAQGVKVLDLTPEFLAHRIDRNEPLYCKTDTHWSGVACVRAARAIAKELSTRSWFKSVPAVASVVEEKHQSIHGDLLLDSDPSVKDVQEEIQLRFVGTKSRAGLEPLKNDPSSPVLILSDSHGLVFHAGEELFARGAGLPDQLAHELGWPVDLIASRGDGVSKVRIDLYQRAKADVAWLASKKVVVWCFSAREFTESTNGWRKIPVKK